MKIPDFLFASAKVLATSLMLNLVSPALAGPSDVVRVTYEKTGDRQYRFRVTVEHADEGWNHYADQWDVLTLDNQLLASRVLHHPHVNEQPFTRSLSGVVLPEGLKQVKIRARDSKHGYSKNEVVIDLPERN